MHLKAEFASASSRASFNMSRSSTTARSFLSILKGFFSLVAVLVVVAVVCKSLLPRSAIIPRKRQGLARSFLSFFPLGAEDDGES